MKSDRFVASVLIPAYALLCLFVVVPIIGSFVIALFDYNPIRDANPFVGLDNVARLFKDELFIKAVANTFKFVFFAVGVNLVITLVIAQVICKLPAMWMRNLFRVVFFMPCVAPLAGTSVVWSRSLLPIRTGLFNMILNFFGMDSVNWIGDASMLMTSLVILTVWSDIGYNIIMFTAGIDGIPTDFYEAADIDGAGPVNKFFRITLPLLGRTLSFVTAMTLISHFQMFAQFQIIARSSGMTGGVGRAGLVLTNYIYDVGFRIKDMGYASAISVALFAIIMVVTVCQQRLNRVDWGY